jgi:hypothetical protein
MEELHALILYILAWVVVSLLILWKLIFQFDPSKLPRWKFSKFVENPTLVGATDYEQRILVVGAGFCGLGIGGAFKRYGIAYDCVEKEDSIGGNWNNGVYESCHIISSRKTTEFKDFPMPEGTSDFPSCFDMINYLRSYCEFFGLMDSISLNTTVDLVEYDETNKLFDVSLSFKNGRKERRMYKGVVVANGHHWSKRFPTFKGDFSGDIIHSKDYKKADQIIGKRILVVGGGNSACDIAVEASRFAVSSHISMRRGYWFIPRAFAGIPAVEMVRPWMPLWMQRILVYLMIRATFGSFAKYGLQEPDHKIFQHHPVINSELLQKIHLGDVKPHGDIERCDGKTVFFKDGTQVEVDVIVCATGYHVGAPFLHSSLVRYKRGIPQFVGGLFSPSIPHLYYFGYGQVRYGAGPLITLGADFLAHAIQVQDACQRPVGALLRKLGVKNPQKARMANDVLVDPHVAHTGMVAGKWLLRFVPLLDRYSS